jgi:hypothetical protein
VKRVRRLIAVCSLVLLAPAVRAEMLADSTVRESWKLPNGLEVRTLHLPGAAGVAVTVAYRAGSGYEPANLEGLADLLAEVHYTAAAGDFPERTRAEMASQRPLGWEARPGTRLVRFTEIATSAQLPGVLQQIARRMSGVTVTDASLKRALADVRRDHGQHYFGEPADVLYWRAAAIARGATDERIVQSASLPGLDKTTARDLAPWLQRWYHAGNASLGIAGDLSGMDARQLVTTLFGPLPGGAALPDTVSDRVRGARRTGSWNGLKAPVGIVAASSPALSDSLHPSFYLGMLITGPALTHAWGAATEPLRTRFQYSLLDEPELVRFYPPAPREGNDPERLAGALYEMLQVVGGQQVVAPVLNRVRRSVRWMLGAELPADLRERLQKQPGGLGTLANNLATRALWRGDAFWRDYLGRFDRQAMGHSSFYEWITKPEHQTVLLLTP